MIFRFLSNLFNGLWTEDKRINARYLEIKNDSLVEQYYFVVDGNGIFSIEREGDHIITTVNKFQLNKYSKLERAKRDIIALYDEEQFNINANKKERV